MHLRTCLLLCVTWALSGVVAPPVTQTTKSPNDIDAKENEAQDEFNVEYDRYLKEVVQALESDPQFRDKLQKAEDADVRSGKIAQELEFVSHAVRTRLDEVKRTEVERLRKYARKAYELKQGLDTEHLGIQSAPDPEHIDHANPDTFEVEDLRRLIAKTTKDLAEADKKRREEFKEYEMQKEFENHEKVKNMTEEEQKKFESNLHEMEEKHKKHAPLHHPISKPQLEEVWEKTDHMDSQDFDPKTFFHLHDLDGNGVWDFDEVKALFLKELDKMYQASAPEDDMRERVEEMERMREHVFSEADTNRDGLISYEEFLAQTQKKDFNSDPGWETLDQQQVYTPEEYHKFEMQRQHEIEAMMAGGRLQHPQDLQYGHPQQFQGHPQQGHPQQFQGQGYPQQGHPQQFQGHPQQGHPQQFQGHPQQGYPQQFQGHPQQGHPQQFQGHPQQGHPQQFQGHPQQGQPQQFQAPPQQGHPQQFQAPPPQYESHPQQGQPQHFQAPLPPQPPQYQGQQQQYQQQPPAAAAPVAAAPVAAAPAAAAAPQPIHNQPLQSQGSPESHIASQQAAPQPHSGQALPLQQQGQQPPQAGQPSSDNHGQASQAVKQV